MQMRAELHRLDPKVDAEAAVIVAPKGGELQYATLPYGTIVSKSGPPTKTTFCTVSHGRLRLGATKQRETFHLPSNLFAAREEGKWKVSLCLLAPPRADAVCSIHDSFCWRTTFTKYCDLKTPLLLCRRVSMESDH